MKQAVFRSFALGVGVLVAGVVALPVSGASAATFCPSALAVQPFVSSLDTGWYTQLPGESIDNFSGIGWAQSGGAKIVTVKVADGSTGRVLDLPPGASAKSAMLCLPPGFQYARVIARAAGTAGTSFPSLSVSLTGFSVSGGASILSTGNWTLSAPLALLPHALLAPAAASFKVTNSGSAGDLQLYDFYLKRA